MFDFTLSFCISTHSESCDFAHPTAPNGTQTNVVCEYFASKRGCKKGEECNFLHPHRVNPSGEDALKYCDFYLTPAGCAESKNCKFLHPRAMPSKVHHTERRKQ